MILLTNTIYYRTLNNERLRSLFLGVTFCSFFDRIGSNEEEEEKIDMEKISDINHIKCDRGVIAINEEGEVLVTKFDEINVNHSCCFSDIEENIDLDPDYGMDQMEHAWFLARNGIISFQIAKNICYLITSPDTITSIQLERFFEVVRAGFRDVKQFSVDLVDGDHHVAIEIDGKSEYDISGLQKCFSYCSLKKKRVR